MATNKITLNELRSIIRQVIKEENENIGLPKWVVNVELENNNEVLLYADKIWVNKNKQSIQKNVENYWMFYSRSQSMLLNKMSGYNSEKDYITDNGQTIINNKPVGINSADKLENRKKMAQERYNSIIKRGIEILDPTEVNYIHGIITNDEINGIKNNIFKKYGKVIGIYIIL